MGENGGKEEEGKQKKEEDKIDVQEGEAGVTWHGG